MADWVGNEALPLKGESMLPATSSGVVEIAEADSSMSSIPHPVAVLGSLPPERKTKRGDRQYGRSRVTNGKTLFVEVDGRGPWARRWSDIYTKIISDLGREPSEGERQLARRAATLSVFCEKMEGETAAGHEGEAAADHDIDLEQYGQITDRLGRCLARLGIKRQGRDGGPTLSDYLKKAQKS